MLRRSHDSPRQYLTLSSLILLTFASTVVVGVPNPDFDFKELEFKRITETASR
jgi:hypothetical protein